MNHVDIVNNATFDQKIAALGIAVQIAGKPVYNNKMNEKDAMNENDKYLFICQQIAKMVLIHAASIEVPPDNHPASGG